MLENLLKFADQVRRDMGLSDVDIVFTPYSLIVEKMPLGLRYVEVRGVASPEMNKVIIHCPKGANESAIKRTIVEELIHFYVPGHGEDFKRLHQAYLEQYGITDPAKLYASILMTAIPVVVGFGLMASGSGVEDVSIKALGTKGTHSYPGSYPGQTPESGCIECLVRHYSKALGLMEEGKRFSLKGGKLTHDARNRVRLAVKEMVTAEEDLGTKIEDKKLKKMIDEIDVKQRDLRKYIWAEKLTTTQEDIESLRGAIDRARELVDLTYRAAVIAECPHCGERSVEEICQDLPEEKRVKCTEALKVIMGGGKEEFRKVLEKG